MDARVALQPAYVLHATPFQNSSLIVDLFTLDYGRVRAVSKGARGAKSRTRSLLQPFQPLLVSLSGRSELKTLTAVEAMHEALRLEATRLYSGLYVNELLTRLLQNQEEHRTLYGAYRDTLVALRGSAPVETVLRHFELSLLAELGYGINLEHEADSRSALVGDRCYRFDPQQGFYAIAALESSEDFSGRDLIALREGRFDGAEAARAAKRLTRLALNAQLGPRPLNSRSLFVSLKGKRFED